MTAVHVKRLVILEPATSDVLNEYREGIFFQRFPEAVCFIIQPCKFNIEWFEDPSFAVAGIIAAFYPLVIIIPDGKIERLQVEQVDAVDETHFQIDEGFGIRKAGCRW